MLDKKSRAAAFFALSTLDLVFRLLGCAPAGLSESIITPATWPRYLTADRQAKTLMAKVLLNGHADTLLNTCGA